MDMRIPALAVLFYFVCMIVSINITTTTITIMIMIMTIVMCLYHYHHYHHHHYYYCYYMFTCCITCLSHVYYCCKIPPESKWPWVAAAGCPGGWVITILCYAVLYYTIVLYIIPKYNMN